MVAFSVNGTSLDIKDRPVQNDNKDNATKTSPLDDAFLNKWHTET